jgi:glycosyltransferase involved in cell wall biosynthesis
LFVPHAIGKSRCRHHRHAAENEGKLVDKLVVLSHLRWDWVWQRPQHLVSRLGAGKDVWFIEEPLAGPCEVPRFMTRSAGPVTRCWLEVPTEVHPFGFGPEWRACHVRALRTVVGDLSDALVWLYAPNALDIVEALEPATVVYDMMDDLSSFLDATPELVLRQARALRAADIVFTGGRSLQRLAQVHRPTGSHLFASGVDVAHWRKARTCTIRGERRVAGYVGVIDERLDLDLIEDLALALPDWEIRMVGPVTKIDEAMLPRTPNIVWAGPRTYGELPAELGAFDVALMPFALNGATRSISPTKTLEYLAAGLPVVSTRVPDVVAEHEDVVDLRDDGPGFAAACREVVAHDLAERDRKLAPLLEARSWDRIAREMQALIDDLSQRTPDAWEQVTA